MPAIGARPEFCRAVPGRAVVAGVVIVRVSRLGLVRGLSPVVRPERDQTPALRWATAVAELDQSCAQRQVDQIDVMRR